jgi:hypothetical protein
MDEMQVTGQVILLRYAPIAMSENTGKIPPLENEILNEREHWHRY